MGLSDLLMKSTSVPARTELSRHTREMRSPRTYEELRRALDDAAETSFVEYKRQLPERNKNHDIAIDVTAMSVDGGVIVYGVEEDQATRKFSLAPIDLAGVPERIANVVRDRAGGDVIFHVHTIDDPEPANAGKGYVVVDVPASPPRTSRG